MIKLYGTDNQSSSSKPEIFVPIQLRVNLPMPTLLVRNAAILVTMDGNAGKFPAAAYLPVTVLLSRSAVRKSCLPGRHGPGCQRADRASRPGQYPPPFLPNPYPGRACGPECQPVHWLKTLYPIWARMTPEDIFISTQTALAELALSGCTTASDHLYLFPNGSKLDDEIAGAAGGGPALAGLPAAR